MLDEPYTMLNFFENENSKNFFFLSDLFFQLDQCWRFLCRKKSTDSSRSRTLHISVSFTNNVVVNFRFIFGAILNIWRKPMYISMMTSTLFYLFVTNSFNNPLSTTKWSSLQNRFSFEQKHQPVFYGRPQPIRNLSFYWILILQNWFDSAYVNP